MDVRVIEGLAREERWNGFLKTATAKQDNLGGFLQALDMLAAQAMQINVGIKDGIVVASHKRFGCSGLCRGTVDEGVELR